MYRHASATCVSVNSRRVGEKLDLSSAVKVPIHQQHGMMTYFLRPDKSSYWRAGFSTNSTMLLLLIKTGLAMPAPSMRDTRAQARK